MTSPLVKERSWKFFYEMVAKIDFSQFGHVALFVFVCRELWKNFPKKPEKKCWSQSYEISNWNILQDILITFFFQRSFSDTWKRLKMIVAFYFELLFFGKELFVTMYVILELGHSPQCLSGGLLTSSLCSLVWLLFGFSCNYRIKKTYQF